MGWDGAADSARDVLRPAPAPQSTKAVYDRILDLRIATPQIVINYAVFLEEHKYFEESFKVRGADLGVPGGSVSSSGPRALCQCPLAALTKYHRAGDLMETCRLSPGGRKSQIVVSAGLVSPEASLLGVQAAVFSPGPPVVIPVCVSVS